MLDYIDAKRFMTACSDIDTRWTGVDMPSPLLPDFLVQIRWVQTNQMG